MNNLNNAKKDNFSRKTILVTGAAGFIGSRLIVELLRDGHQVVAALRNAATKKEKLLGFIATQGLTDPSISFVEYDLSHDFKLDSLLTDTQKRSMLFIILQHHLIGALAKLKLSVRMLNQDLL